MRTISSRLVMLVATAAVAPLVLYGFVSIGSLRTATRESVTAGNLKIAARAAEQVDQYVVNDIKILRAIAAELNGTQLAPWQQDRALKNYLLQFPEFREITVFDAAGRAQTTSRITAATLHPPPAGTDVRSVYIAPVTVDDDLLPHTMLGVPLGDHGEAGWLVGELRLEELWRMVDRIRVGQQGFALLLAGDGRLIAHGHPDAKRRIARGENLAGHPVLRQPRDPRGTQPFLEFVNASGARTLAVAAAAPQLGWSVIVEQPTLEAYAVARRLERQLGVTIGLALLGTIAVGYAWGRSFLRPIQALMRGTRAIAAGRLDERVQIGGSDEFRQLGDAFNSMSDQLVDLQEDVRRQARQAMFGRIAIGLVHDISHPIQNIGNSCKLILKMFEDAEYRATFKRTVDRELVAIKRVLEDLRNLARPIPLERFPIDVNRSVADVVEVMRPLAESAGLSIDAELAPEPLFVEGDLFALGRVYRNLVINAIQATAPGGAISVATERDGERIRVIVDDTGCGIAPDRLGAIFDDYMTTKRRGLGLGLAISKKIVEQLDGTIGVTSVAGRGATFTIELPVTSARPATAAAS